MADKRTTLNINDSFIIIKALQTLVENSGIDKSVAAEVGRARIENLIKKISG